MATSPSDADGQVHVTGGGGTRRPVEVLASVGGVAVVDGLAEGDQVRLPAPDTDQTGPGTETGSGAG